MGVPEVHSALSQMEGYIRRGDFSHVSFAIIGAQALIAKAVLQQAVDPSARLKDHIGLVTQSCLCLRHIF